MDYISKIDNQLQNVKEELITLINKKATLPLCQALGSECVSYKKLTEHINEQIVKLGEKKKSLEEKKIQIQDLQAKLDRLTFEPSLIKKYRAEKQELQTSYSKYLDLDKKQVQSDIDVMKSNLESKRVQVIEKKNQLKSIEELSTEEVVNFKSEIQEAKDKKLLTETKLKNAEILLASRKDLLNRFNSKKDRLLVIESKLPELKNQIGYLDILIQAFSSKGIPNMIIETVLPILEAYSNEILQEIFPSLNIRFETEREKASGDGLIQVLDIIVTDGDNERPLENYSGGESQTINFSIRRALSKLLSELHSINISLLIIDEAVQGLSKSIETKFLSVLQNLQSEFENIYMISHIDSVKEIFNNQIFLYKEGGITLTN